MGRQGRSTIGSTTSSTSSVAASIRDSILLLGSAGGLAFRGASVPTASTVEYGYSRGVKRRALLNEELMMDDDCYDDNTLHEKKRRLTSEQVHLLEESFEAENKLEPEKKSELAKKLGLQPRQVAVWYQNRRARWKTKQLERDFDRLKALYDNLVADHGSLLADNQRLRSEVASLTEQLLASATATSQATGHHPPLPRNSQYDNVPPVSEPSATTPAVSLEAKDDFSHHLQLPDDRSFHGGCLYMASSDEDDFSDDGCGYFPPAFPEDDHGGIEQCGTSRYDDMPPLPEDEAGGLVGWWIWS